MQTPEKTKEEIQARADKMSDFLKMEYLESCSKTKFDIEILRYCYKELSRLYEKNIMYSEAVKYITKLRSVSLNQKEKIQTYTEEIELLIKGGFYEQANGIYKKLILMVEGLQKYELQMKLIEFYKKEVKKFEDTHKNAWALKAYEKLLPLVPDNDKLEIKRKLFTLYKKLGKVRESLEIEKELS